MGAVAKNGTSGKSVKEKPKKVKAGTLLLGIHCAHWDLQYRGSYYPSNCICRRQSEPEKEKDHEDVFIHNGGIFPRRVGPVKVKKVRERGGMLGAGGSN